MAEPDRVHSVFDSNKPKSDLDFNVQLGFRNSIKKSDFVCRSPSELESDQKPERESDQNPIRLFRN